MITQVVIVPNKFQFKISNNSNSHFQTAKLILKQPAVYPSQVVTKIQVYSIKLNSIINQANKIFIIQTSSSSTKTKHRQINLIYLELREHSLLMIWVKVLCISRRLMIMEHRFSRSIKTLPVAQESMSITILLFTQVRYSLGHQRARVQL